MRENIFQEKYFHTSSYWMRKTPQKWLSEFSAGQLINELIRANSNKNNYEKLIFTGTRIIAILGTVLFLINLFSNMIRFHHSLVFL